MTSRRMKLMEELDEKRQKQWKLNKTRIVNESHLSHKLSVEICPPIVEVPIAGTTRIDLEAIAPKPPQRVVKAKSLYSRTIAPKDFDIIGNGRPSGKIDSAGSHLNLRHAVRQTQRMKLMLALDRYEKPVGSVNTQAIAQRIEGMIFKVLMNDAKQYRQQILAVKRFIMDRKNWFSHVRDMLLGRTHPEDIALLTKDPQMTQIIALRMKWRLKDEKWKIKQLKKAMKPPLPPT